MPAKVLETSQPMNMSHPLAQGVYHWWLPMPNNYGYRNTRDIAADRRYVENLEANGGVGAANPYTGLLSIRSAPGYVLTKTQPTLSQYTVSVWWKLINGTAASIVGHVAQYQRIGISSSTNLRIYPADHTTFTDVAIAADTAYFHNVIVSYVSGGACELWYDGVHTSLTTVTANAIWSRISIDRWSQYWQGDISSLQIYNRAISEKEALDLYIEGRTGWPNLLNWYTPRTWLFGSAVQNGAFARQLTTGNIPGMNQWKPQRSR